MALGLGFISMSSTSGRLSLTAALVAVLATASLLVGGSEARTVVVGDSRQWRPGVNYTDWALRNPLYIGDNLVFRYEAPSKSSRAHSVYLLPNMWSYLNCDLAGAKLLANSVQGSGSGFPVTLNQWRLYYFVSGEGSDCKDGMKFLVMPLPRWNF